MIKHNSKVPEDVIKRIKAVQFEYDKLIVEGTPKQKTVNKLVKKFKITETTIRRYIKKPRLD